MAWFCSGYSPRRFILATVKSIFIGYILDNRLARVEQSGKSWKWFTFVNTSGAADSASEAMKQAERSLDTTIERKAKGKRLRK